MTSGEITAMVVAVLPAVGTFILQLRHGWRQQETAAKVEEIHQAVTAEPANPNQVERCEKIRHALRVQHSHHPTHK